MALRSPFTPFGFHCDLDQSWEINLLPGQRLFLCSNLFFLVVDLFVVATGDSFHVVKLLVNIVLQHELQKASGNIKQQLQKNKTFQEIL